MVLQNWGGGGGETQVGEWRSPPPPNLSIKYFKGIIMYIMMRGSTIRVMRCFCFSFFQPSSSTSNSGRSHDMRDTSEDFSEVCMYIILCQALSIYSYTYKNTVLCKLVGAAKVRISFKYL